MTSRHMSCWECRGNISRRWHRAKKKGKFQCHVCYEMSKRQKKMARHLPEQSKLLPGRRSLKKQLFQKRKTEGKPLSAYGFGLTIVQNCNYLSLATHLRMVPSIRHEGCVYQRGDIVSLTDDSTHLTYYARIDEVLVSSDDFGFFGISWLVPKVEGALLGPFRDENFELSYIHPVFVPVDRFKFIKTAT
uniref:GATA-type domain-containing protein n=1 Tax=Trichuris muris TaxID=70415 RepID=A0A5S6QAJ0_TRIMR